MIVIFHRPTRLETLNGQLRSEVFGLQTKVDGQSTLSRELSPVIRDNRADHNLLRELFSAVQPPVLPLSVPNLSATEILPPRSLN